MHNTNTDENTTASAVENETSTPAPATPPPTPEVSALEGEVRKGNMDARTSASPDRGIFHRRFMWNMHATFLTVLVDGKIMAFVAGALRRKASVTVDEITSFTCQDFLQARREKTAETRLRVSTLKGANKGNQTTVDFQSIPFNRFFLGITIPEATRFGVYSVYPDPQLGSTNGIPNGTNAEWYLDSRTWRLSRREGQIMGSGGSSLRERLHPDAEAYAETCATAWPLAVTAAGLYGGQPDAPRPNAEHHAALAGMAQAEEDFCRNRQIRHEQQRAAQRVNSRWERRQRPLNTSLSEIGEQMDAANANK